MKKVMRLVSVQLWAVLGDFLSIGGTKKKTPKVLYAGVVFFVLLMSGISFFYSLMLGSGLKMFDSLELLPVVMMAVTCIIILMTTIFKVKGTIFGFRDYDLVMSLPVSTGTIVASRLFILYAINFLFVIIMIIPMMIVYGLLAKPSMAFYIIGIITMFFIPFLPIIVASILGTIIAYVASRFRYSNFLNIIFSLALFLGIMGLSFTIDDNGQEMVDMGKALTNQVYSIYPFASLYRDAIIDYNILSFLLFLGISLVAFLLYTLVVKVVFKRINTLIMTGRYSTKFKMGELKTSSPLKALYVKELKRYFSSPLYVLNTGFGIVMLTIGAVASIFVDLGEILGDPQATGLFSNNIAVFVVFCVVLTSSTMASISLEGKSLWIIKSMPIDPKTVFFAKILVNLTIISPAILDSIILVGVFNLGSLKTLLMVLITFACALFISFFGLLINLLLPNLNWTSEVIVIKQSAASMVTIFSAMGYVGLLIISLVLLPSYSLAYLVYFILTVVIDVILYRIVLTYGTKRFLAL